MWWSDCRWYAACSSSSSRIISSLSRILSILLHQVTALLLLAGARRGGFHLKLVNFEARENHISHETEGLSHKHLVVRRGKPFKVTLLFGGRAWDPHADVLSLQVWLGTLRLWDLPRHGGIQALRLLWRRGRHHHQIHQCIYSLSSKRGYVGVDAPADLWRQPRPPRLVSQGQPVRRQSPLRRRPRLLPGPVLGGPVPRPAPRGDLQGPPELLAGLLRAALQPLAERLGLGLASKDAQTSTRWRAPTVTRLRCRWPGVHASGRPERGVHQERLRVGVYGKPPEYQQETLVIRSGGSGETRRWVGKGRRAWTNTCVCVCVCGWVSSTSPGSWKPVCSSCRSALSTSATHGKTTSWGPTRCTSAGSSVPWWGTRKGAPSALSSCYMDTHITSCI